MSVALKKNCRMAVAFMSCVVSGSMLCVGVSDAKIHKVATLEHASAHSVRQTTLTVKPGDVVVMQCGARYGPLHVRVLGGAGPTATIKPASRCLDHQRPVVDGRLAVDWQRHGQQDKARWYADVPQPVALVFSGGRPLARARFPRQGYLITPPSSKLMLKDRLPEAAFENVDPRSLEGAVLHARTKEWLLEEAVIEGVQGRLSHPLNYPLRPRTGYYFSGKSWMLDGVEHQWAHDHASGRVWTSSTAQPTHTVSLKMHLLRIEGDGALEVNGIDFIGSGLDAINANLRGTLSLKDVHVRFAAGNAINVVGAQEVRVEASLLEDLGRDGIFLSAVGRALVLANRIERAGMLNAPGPALAAINAHGARSAVILRNHVLTSAYIGVRFAGTAIVAGNMVEDSCLVLSDCAALYTWRRAASDRRGPVLVYGNAVLNVGLGGDTSVKLGVNDWFAGIYLDEWAREVTARENLVVGANQGIYLHNAFENFVNRNWVFESRVADVLDLVDAELSVELSQRPAEVPNDTGSAVANTSARSAPVVRELVGVGESTVRGLLVFVPMNTVGANDARGAFPATCKSQLARDPLLGPGHPPPTPSAIQTPGLPWEHLSGSAIRPAFDVVLCSTS